MRYPSMRMLAICSGALVLLAGCNPEPSSERASVPEHRLAAVQTDAAPPGVPDCCALVRVPHFGSSPTDLAIAGLQAKARDATDATNLIERLGWMYVRKARESFDPGFYKLAEQCALCLETRHPHSPEALLLRGHALHSLHHFKEAEALSVELVHLRGMAADFGLLGDALMEQGKLDEAAKAYQKMVDLRPELQSYARGAHMRWLKGNLEGAVELMTMAARAGSPHDPESAAWAYTRLAFYQSLSKAPEQAAQACAGALEFQKDYPPALLLRGRLLLSGGEEAKAVDDLTRATQLNPLPEYQWALAEALRKVGREQAAVAVESTLRRTAAINDPRTFALYLATRSESVETALQLTEEELLVRRDVFTQDARAWTLAAAGRLEEAQEFMARATAEGTFDARLFFHATVIAAKSGHKTEAQSWSRRTADLMRLLLPSESEHFLLLAPTLEEGAAGGKPRTSSNLFGTAR